MSENPRNGATARWRERLEHHNLALKAIRNVNQLITRAKDRQALLQGVCAALTGTGGYFNAWIALFDEHGALTDICESGLGEDFCPMVEHLQSGRRTRCSRQALAKGGAVVVEDPAAVCTDCPLSAMSSGRAAMSAPLAHEGQTFGVLSVSIPAALAGDEEERELFEEVANDIGFALHSLASEEAHATACEALRESEEVMRYIIKHDPNALAVYDTGLHYLAVSDRYLNDYEIADQNILGKHHYEVFPEMPQRWRDVHQRVLDGSIEGNDDDWFERPDGSITYNRWECRPWYKAEGSIGGMITYTEVTTERKKAEDALRKSEEKFRTYVEAAPEGIFIANDEGRYIDVNETACEMTGYTREELLNMTVMDLAAPNSESEITESFTHLKRDGHSVA